MYALENYKNLILHEKFQKYGLNISIFQLFIEN